MKEQLSESVQYWMTDSYRNVDWESQPLQTYITNSHTVSFVFILEHENKVERSLLRTY